MLTRKSRLLIVGALLIVSVAGCKSGPRHESNWAHELASNTPLPPPEPTSSYSRPAADEWVCPMHPRVKQPEPGTCSICGMDLVHSDSLSDTRESSSGSGHLHTEGAHSKGSGRGCCGG